MSHLHPEGTLSDVLDDQLDAKAQRAWQQHLTECEACRNELEALRQVQLAARSWIPQPMATDNWSALKAKVAAGPVATIKAPHRRGRRFMTLAVASTLAIAAMLMLVFRSRQPAPSWPSHVLASASTVASLDTVTRPLLAGIAVDARDEFTALLADADASLHEIEALRTETVDSALLTEVYLQALDSKQRLLEGIRDYHHEGE